MKSEKEVLTVVSDAVNAAPVPLAMVAVTVELARLGQSKEFFSASKLDVEQKCSRVERIKEQYEGHFLEMPVDIIKNQLRDRIDFQIKLLQEYHRVLGIKEVYNAEPNTGNEVCERNHQG